MAERNVPLQWLIEPLDGPNAYIDVPYILHEAEEVDYQHDRRRVQQRRNQKQLGRIITGEDEDGGDSDDDSKSDGGDGSDDTATICFEDLVVDSGSCIRDLYQCLLCETGKMSSVKACQNHVKGKRHLRNYQRLQRQQIAYSLNQQANEYCTNLKEIVRINTTTAKVLPSNGGRNGSAHSSKKKKNLSSSSSYANYWSICCDDSREVEFLSLDLSEEEIEQEDVPHYILPYRRWHSDGYWITGWTCELCGTREMTTRSAVLQHCITSKRHSVHRNLTLCGSYDHGGCVMYGEYHPECQRLLRHIRCEEYDNDSGNMTVNGVSSSSTLSSHSASRSQSLLLPTIDKWRIERLMLQYLACKESSMLLGIDSRQHTWHKILRKYQYYYRRHMLSLLELTIWKNNMTSSLLRLPHSSTSHDEGDNKIGEDNKTNSGDDDSVIINKSAKKIVAGNEDRVEAEDQQKGRMSRRRLKTVPELRKYYEHHHCSKDKNMVCWESFMEECRVTSGITVIIDGVTPFLF